jgi:hypothetical protein
VGLTAVLLIGTLNRVMIVELGVSAALVSLMVSLPLVLAPFRALIGFRSDRHRSALGWKRVPYIWIGFAAAVLRPRDHALRAHHPVRRHLGAGLGRAGGGGAGLPDGGRGHAHRCRRRGWPWPPTFARRRRIRAWW